MNRRLSQNWKEIRRTSLYKITGINKADKANTKFKDALVSGNNSHVKKYLDKYPEKVDEKLTWDKIFTADEVPPLHIAASGTNIDVIVTLFDYDADPHLLTESGKNALHFSAFHEGCNIEIVDKLINKGVDTNVKDDDECTPLMIAVKHNNVGVVRCLLENFADQEIANSDGELPMDIAKKRDNSTILGLLNKHKKKPVKNDGSLDDVKKEMQNMTREMLKMKAEFKMNLNILKAEISKSKKNEDNLTLSSDTVDKLVQAINSSLAEKKKPESEHSFKSVSRMECSNVDIDCRDFESQNSVFIAPVEVKKTESMSSLFSVKSIYSQASANKGYFDEEDGVSLDAITARERYNIQKNYSILISCIHADRIIIPLFEAMLIDAEVKTHVESLVGNRSQNDYLLLQVIISGPSKKLLTFLNILEETDQSYAANIIRGIPRNNELKKYSISAPFSNIEYLKNRKFTQSEFNLHWPSVESLQNDQCESLQNDQCESLQKDQCESLQNDHFGPLQDDEFESLQNDDFGSLQNDQCDEQHE